MTGPRVALVSRRYWPQVGAAETITATLAGELRRLTARPQIVTAQADKSWPEHVVHREIPVTRLPKPHSRLWGSYRYLGNLARWLKAHRETIDLVCVSGLRFDAYTALGALAGSGVPVVLRAERAGPDGDCHWQRRASFGSRVFRRCLGAEAIIAPSEKIAAELCAAGYSSRRIRVVYNGVSAGGEPAPGARLAAREALAAVHPLLAVALHAPLVVCVERFVEGSRLVELVDAWSSVCRRWAEARLWLIGQGPLAERVWQRVRRNELEHNVILTGLFDDLSDVLRAADLLVKPAADCGSGLALLEALAAGLPIVAADLPSTLEFVEGGRHALLVPEGNVPALASALIELLSDAALAERLSQAALRRAQEQFSAERMAAEHLALFEQLLGGKNR